MLNYQRVDGEQLPVWLQDMHLRHKKILGPIDPNVDPKFVGNSGRLQFFCLDMGVSENVV